MGYECRLESKLGCCCVIVLKIEHRMLCVATVTVIFLGRTHAIGIVDLVKADLLNPAQAIVVTGLHRQTA